MNKFRIGELHYKKELLGKAPEEDRKVYLMLGHLFNDINYLTKLAMLTVSNHFEKGIESLGNVSQSFYLLRVLAGRLYEANRFMQRNGKILNEYTLTCEELQKLFDEIKSYFGDPQNYIKLIRHNFAYHHSESHFLDGYAVLPENTDFTDYLGEHISCTLFGAAAEVELMSLAKIIPSKFEGESLTELTQEVYRISAVIGRFALKFGEAFQKKHIEPYQQDFEVIYVDRIDDPPVDHFKLPYLFSPPSNFYE